MLFDGLDFGKSFLIVDDYHQHSEMKKSGSGGGDSVWSREYLNPVRRRENRHEEKREHDTP